MRRYNNLGRWWRRSDIGKKIKKLRKDRKISQRQLADMTTMTNSYISKIESGERHPSLDAIIEFGNALGIRPIYLTSVGDRPCPLCGRE